MSRFGLIDPVDTWKGNSFSVVQPRSQVLASLDDGWKLMKHTVEFMNQEDT
jgi:hypothetical protein